MKWKGGEQSKNFEDRRRMSPKGLALGGGTLIVVVIGLLLGFNPQQIKQFIGQAQLGGNPKGNGAAGRELTPEEEQQREFASTILRFTEVVWDEQFRLAGQRYEPPSMVMFSEEVETGCGVAPSAVGPFYCPRDRTVYLDPTFFDELAQSLGGSKAEFSQAYVIAHETGHHVQNLLGYNDLVDQKRQTSSKAEANQWSVRLELQADYLAGVWAHHGQKKFHFIEPGDIEAAITSANAIGDDRLQRRSSGFTSPEKYTHGTSKQRVRWFTLGLQTGNMEKLPDFFQMPYNQL